jgi:tetratricopeptide (TPR) repeat protein
MKAVWAKRFDVAAREFGKIVALEPNNAEARVSLARSLYMQGQAALAREQLEQALSREPGHAKAHYFLGRLLREQGSSEAALEHFRATLETDPNHAGALYVLGEVLTRAGQDAQAQAHLAKVVEQFPQETTPRLLLARALAKTGQADQARKQLENGVQMYPGEAGLRRMLARLLAASPQPEVRDGRRALALAVALFDQRNSIENAETVAMAYAEVGDFETAHAYQQAAIDAAMRFGGFADLPRLNANLALYRKTTPCRTPWPEGGEFSELEPFSDATSE